MKQLPLSRGEMAVVCDCHYDLVKNYKWHFKAEAYGGYAQTNVRAKPGVGGQKGLRMHRLITNAPDGMDVDHINGDKLDNRCSNLRICTRQQNCWNVPTPRHNTSGYKGVQWRKDRQKWIAVIRVDNNLKRVGSFDTPQEASLAYQEAAKKYFGEFAR